MKKNRILITGCNAGEIDSHIQFIKQNNNSYIVGVDIVESTDTNVDKYYKVLRCNEKCYIDQLIDICKKEKIDILIPTIDTELEELSKAKEKFKPTKVAVMDYEILKQCNSKIKLYETLDQKGIKTPEYRAVYSKEDIIYLLKNKSVIKAPYGFGSRGIRIIDNERDYYNDFLNKKPNNKYIKSEDFIKILPETFELLVMEYLDGSEYSTEIYAKDGKTIVIVGVENAEVDNSTPYESIIKYDKEAYEISKEIVSKLKLSGYIGIDFKRNKGKLEIMEVNPRVTATYPLICKSGVNIIDIGIKDMLNEPITFNQYNETKINEIKMKRKVKEVYYKGNEGN